MGCTTIRHASCIALMAAALLPSTSTGRTYAVEGTVRDLGLQRYAADGAAAGEPIGGATVVVGRVLILGATPPPALPRGDVATITNADGTYAVSGYDGRGRTYVMVFPPAGDRHLSLHARADIADAKIRPLFLYAPSPAETAELARIAADRADNGAGPLIPDEIAFETARAHADFMAVNGYYQHCIPAALCFVVPTFPSLPPAEYAPRYASPNDLYSALGGALEVAPRGNWTENFYVGWPAGNPKVGSWPAADAWFMAEKCNVTGTCAAGPVAGGVTAHYENIVAPRHIWVGLGDNAAARPPAVNGAPVRRATYADFIQEFYSEPNLATRDVSRAAFDAAIPCRLAKRPTCGRIFRELGHTRSRRCGAILDAPRSGVAEPTSAVE